MLMTSLVDEMGDVGDNSPAPIDPKAYHDRVVFSPRRIGNHRELLLLQFTLNKTASAVMIHVLDSAEGKLSKAQRQEYLHKEVQSLVGRHGNIAINCCCDNGDNSGSRRDAGLQSRKCA